MVVLPVLKSNDTPARSTGYEFFISQIIESFKIWGILQSNSYKGNSSSKISVKLVRVLLL
jgi:hypothetical protein